MSSASEGHVGSGAVLTHANRRNSLIQAESPCPWNLTSEIGKVFWKIRNPSVMYGNIFLIGFYSVISQKKPMQTLL